MQGGRGAAIVLGQGLDKAKVEVSDGCVRLEPGDAGSCLLVGDIKKTDLDGDGGVGHYSAGPGAS